MRKTALVLTLSLVALSALGGDGSIRRSPQHIPGRYVVVLAENANATAVANKAKGLNGRIHQNYGKGVKGFAVEMSDADAQSLSRDPDVQFVEEDATVAGATQWGLDRIDQRFLPLNGSYVASGTGAGVTVYIVDTGINAAHADFGGRVTAGFNAMGDGATAADCNGHGTFVAGIAGGNTFGVAKSVTLVPVRVMDCTGVGSVSSVLSGLDWVLSDHQAGSPAVVNMSMSGAASTALDNEVNVLLSSGVTTIVAAGNSNADACLSSPARVPGVLTVAASGQSDQRAAFSNYGSCVDLFAPGVSIQSDWYSSNTATIVASGTSASAPFVTGVAAVLLQQYPGASPNAVNQTIIGAATTDVLTDIGNGSPNLLLFSLLDTLNDPTLGSQLLSDPGFDYGETFWTAGICGVNDPTGCIPDDDGSLLPSTAPSYKSHTKNSKAALGGGRNLSAVTSETIIIPAGASRAELSFYLWVVAHGKSLTPDDKLIVEVRNPAGTVLGVIGTYSNLDDSPDYIQHRLDLTAFKGMPIRITFVASENHGSPTWFFLDDTAVKAFH